MTGQVEGQGCKREVPSAALALMASECFESCRLDDNDGAFLSSDVGGHVTSASYNTRVPSGV